MPPNSFFGKKSIIKAIIDNEKAFLLLNQKQRKWALKFGHIVISILGFPLDSGGRMQMCRMFELLKGEGSPLLDVGCSFGSYAFELQKRGFQVRGVDINEINIEVANRIKDILGWGPDFSLANVEELVELPNDFFSTVILSHVVEHLKDPAETFRLLSKKMRPGGAMIVTTAPVTEDAEYKEGYDDFVISGDCKADKISINKLLTGAKHYRVGLTEQKLSRLMTESGLKVEKIDYTRYPNFLKRSQLLFPLVYPVYSISRFFTAKVRSVNIKARKSL
ncbi:MAG: class I SAM-dependent methyltransferase [Candidatus Omnitrophota bacterium]